MAEGICEKTDCTVGTTGTCVLSRPSPAECPHFRVTDASAEIAAAGNPSAATEVPASRAKAQGARKFHLGHELGTQDATEIMRARYTHLISILGSTDAGKTCFLSSLFLMASGGLLPSSHQFAGSLTMQAFEDRARGLRDWPKGGLPDQLVDHTVLSDKRQPSFLHLAIRESKMDRRRFDLLLIAAQIEVIE